MRYSILLLTITPFWLLTSCSRQDISVLIQRTKPSVALLIASDGKGNAIATGSGFWVSEDGKLVSNYHVIRDAKKITARAQNGGNFDVSGILFQDATNDIVILQTEGTGFSPLPLGRSATAQQGDRIVVVGSPIGLQGSASEGIVSAFRKDRLGNLIQMTAAISPGSSGSPVIDSVGEVIGVARLTLEGGQSLNFAVPIEVVRNALTDGLSTQVKPFAEGITLIPLPERTLRIPQNEWTPMKNPADSAVNFEAAIKGPDHRYKQVITVFLNQMSVDRRHGNQISPTEYCELSWNGAYPGIASDPSKYPADPGYLVMQLRIDKGSYWVLSRESFTISGISTANGLKLDQHDFDFRQALLTFPQFDLQAAIDRTRLLIQRTF